MEKQVLKEPNSVQMIDARAAKLSNYKEFKLDSCNKQVRAEPITSEHFVIDTINMINMIDTIDTIDRIDMIDMIDTNDLDTIDMIDMIDT